MTLSDQFERFHDANPHVYAIMCRLARAWLERFGRRKLGIQALFERARWEVWFLTSDPEYKINNNFAAFYARLIMYLEADLDEIFNLRASEADAWLADYIARRDPPEGMLF